MASPRSRASSSAENPYVDWERPVEQAFGPTERHHLHDILGRSGIRFPPPFARIHEGADANSGNMAGPVGRDMLEHVGDDALRQIVRFDLVRNGELLQLRYQAPVAPITRFKRPA